MLERFNINLISPKDTLVIAVSGGIDSMVLLHQMIEIKEQYQLNLHIAHVDHQKRETSAKDAQFVKDIATHYQIPFHLHLLDKHISGNFHDSSHHQRYDFFVQVAQNVKANKIVLAHHLDDQAETILMRLVRGSSFEGYRGIQSYVSYKKKSIIRPLLNVPRSSIIAYQKQHNINYITDESNLENHYTRNRYRHQIIPLIAKENPKYLDKLMQFSRYQDDAYAMIHQESLSVIKKIDMTKHPIIINQEMMRSLYTIIQIEVIKKIVNSITNNQLELSYQNIQDILTLIKNPKPHLKFIIQDKLFINKKYHQIEFSNQTTQFDDYHQTIDDFGEYQLKHGYVLLISKNIDKKYDYLYELCYNNLDSVFPLKIRNRRHGDVLDIQIGTKKLKDFFIDRKIPMDVRNTVPILVNHQNDILFIPNMYRKKTEGDQTIFIHILKETI